VMITTAQLTDVIYVPVNAVYTDVNGSYVWLVEDGHAVRRNVTTDISNDKGTVILEGLSGGETVIAEGEDITEGDAVMDLAALTAQPESTTIGAEG
ncbi:MAG: hypothetical protein PHG02_06240, partial [Oscillospiraceae bacterium]|nr:hypothetical protein [Oscillospiraceae bacterium]